MVTEQAEDAIVLRKQLLFSLQSGSCRKTTFKRAMRLFLWTPWRFTSTFLGFISELTRTSRLVSHVPQCPHLDCLAVCFIDHHYMLVPEQHPLPQLLNLRPYHRSVALGRQCFFSPLPLGWLVNGGLFSRDLPWLGGCSRLHRSGVNHKDTAGGQGVI